MSYSLYKATEGIGEEDLSIMVLTSSELPADFRDFQVAREGVLDNVTMASQGFPGSTTEDVMATGRITGYLREFVSPIQPENLQTDSNLIAATVVHLFRDPESVSQWMIRKFQGEFQQYVGQELTHGEQLISANPVQFEGFFDETAGLRPVQTTHLGLVSSTIVDFRVGRLLGVAYAAALGDVERAQLVREIGLGLERKIVSVVLGSI